jgi:hypothetical protein
MLKGFLSILISLSVLTGSIGFNTVHTDCPVCSGHEESANPASCCAQEPDPLAADESCCSKVDNTETSEYNAFCSMGGECCVFELVKLESPFLLIASAKKINIPDFDLFPGLVFQNNVNDTSQIFLPGIVIIKPPGFRNSLTKFHCNYTC